MLRYVTAGESHGKQLTVIIEGVPAGLRVTAEDINADLSRRQGGYGRGARMKIEKDTVEFVAGVRLGETTGAPVCMVVKNRDWENWTGIMAAEPGVLDEKHVQVRPRPGHADLTGIMKYRRGDIRDILERASARETAARVAAGALCRRFLAELGVEVFSFVREIGGVKADLSGLSLAEIRSRAEKSELRTPDPVAEEKMKEVIRQAAEAGDTVGGVFTVVATGLVPGLGSHTQWDLKLDGLIAMGMMSVQAIKGVEFGLGFAYGSTLGSGSHDEIFYSKDKGFFRETNNAGGVEGGMTNGEPLVVSCAMKSIPSLRSPLKSVDLRTREQDLAEAVRSDVSAVPAAGVVGEAVLSFELARAVKEKFGGDALAETTRNLDAYREYMKNF